MRLTERSRGQTKSRTLSMASAMVGVLANSFITSSKSAAQQSGVSGGHSMDESGKPIKGMEGLGNLPINVHGNLVCATTDRELSNYLLQAKSAKRPVVVNYGATWCHACQQMLPTFCNVSDENPKSLFIYVDVDKCEQETQDVRYTPTFRFFKDGERVDEFYGAGPQRLRDRLWLHS